MPRGAAVIIVAACIASARCRRVELLPQLDEAQPSALVEARAAEALPLRRLALPLLALGATRASTEFARPHRDAAEEAGSGSGFADVVSGLRLAQVSVAGETAEAFEVTLPANWVERFVPDRVDVVHGALSYYSVTAQVASDPGNKVALLGFRNVVPDGARSLYFLQRLSPSGCVPTVFDTIMASDDLMTFALVEWTRTPVSGGKAFWQGMPDEHYDLAGALRWMADLLRAAEAFEGLGLVHGSLTETSVVLDRDGRALVGDFRAACLLGSGSAAIGCAAKPRHTEARRAPGPPGVAGNVWQLGVLFSGLLVGGEAPTAASLLRRRGPLQRISDAARRFRRRGASQELDDWTRRRCKRARREYGDVVRIIQGMLELNPDRRLSASEALDEMERAARRRGVELPPPRRPATAPPASGWWQETRAL